MIVAVVAGAASSCVEVYRLITIIALMIGMLQLMLQ